MLLIAGRPLNEPIAQYGPFVMNSKSEIFQAVEDFRNGRLDRPRKGPAVARPMPLWGRPKAGGSDR